MRERTYYSVRSGKHPTGGRLDFDGAKSLFVSAFREFQTTGHFQQYLGFVCVDAGDVAGSVGTDVEAYFFRKLKKRGLWPIAERVETYSEDDLFDVVELLHDCASKGVDGRFHGWGECGWHYETFDKALGESEFRSVINDILRQYGPGYVLSAAGEIVALAPMGLADLELAPDPPGHPTDVQARLAAAVEKFRRRGASLDQRRDAVRDLADILEFLRPKAKEVLESTDENDLFNIVNNFGIRHHNQRQKSNYDRPIWLSWMFYYYLATIHAVTRLIDRKKAAEHPERRPNKRLQPTARR